MAKAVKTEAPPVKAPDEIVLRLSVDEAKTIQYLVGRIGGNADEAGPRMNMAKIGKALEPFTGTSEQCRKEMKDSGRKVKGYVNFSDPDGTFPDGGMTELLAEFFDLMGYEV